MINKTAMQELIESGVNIELPPRDDEDAEKYMKQKFGI